MPEITFEDWHRTARSSWMDGSFRRLTGNKTSFHRHYEIDMEDGWLIVSDHIDGRGNRRTGIDRRLRRKIKENKSKDAPAFLWEMAFHRSCDLYRKQGWIVLDVG